MPRGAGTPSDAGRGFRKAGEGARPQTAPAGEPALVTEQVPVQLGPAASAWARFGAGPPRVHQREYARIHPATTTPCETVALQGFLYLRCPDGPALYVAEHDS